MTGNKIAHDAGMNQDFKVCLFVVFKGYHYTLLHTYLNDNIIY